MKATSTSEDAVTVLVWYVTLLLRGTNF